ncbi:MAG: oligoendopeptidase F [Clostridia bacterium]|nr:oligoendopeptidase F [Clostridia bacterium]
MRERKDIEQKYKWDLSVIYPTLDDFYADYKKTEGLIKKFASYERTMLNSAASLYETLAAESEIEWYINRLWQYASLGFSVDTSDNASQALNGKVRNLAIKAGTASWFINPYILRLEPEQVQAWFAEEPRLESYRRRIEKTLREKPYTLSDECEQLLSKMEDAQGNAGQVRSLFANADLSFGKIRDAEGRLVELTDTNYVPFLMNGDRRVRQAAFRTLYKTYAQFGNTFASLYNAHVKEATTLARVRGFKDSITASTFQDEVTPEIYNNLISAVSRGLEPLYAYYELKRRVLGVDKFHMYDVYAPLIGEMDRKYDYEEAVDEVLKTARVFGDEYYSALEAGLCEKGWVDVYPTKGKRGGAFSSGCPGTEPYILLNYTESFDDVSTLAHEAGHSMHTYFSTKYNEPHNSSYRIFVAEVASTVNELLMAHRKLEECESDTEKLYILNELMETYKGTLYRQTMFAEFERDMHALCEKGEPLTAELISKHYYKLVKKYFGKDVVCDKQIAYEWMRIPHFFTSFYVYKYSTCISAATAIVRRIESEGEEYVKQYIEFLKCGDSRSPLESLLVAGIDMTSPEVIESAISEFASCVAKFTEIYERSIK